MKKLITLIISVLIMVSMTGCTSFRGKEGLLSKMESDDDQVTKVVEDALIEAVNNKNVEAICELFSEESREKNDDLQTEAENFIEFFEGKLIVETNTSSYMSQGGKLYDEWIAARDGTITLETGEQYTIDFTMVAKSENNKKREGLCNFSIFEGEKTNSPDEFTYGGTGGIEIYVFDESVATNMAQAVVDAINVKDAEAIKALLSENAKEYIFDVDTDIQWLFEAFEGRRISSFEKLENVRETGYIHKHDKNISNRWSRIYVLTLEDGTEYEMKISMYSMDKEDPGNVGLNIIGVIECRQETLEQDDRMNWKSYLGDPLIQVFAY